MGGEGGVEDWQHKRDGAEEGEVGEYGFRWWAWGGNGRNGDA